MRTLHLMYLSALLWSIPAQNFPLWGDGKPQVTQAEDLAEGLYSKEPATRAETKERLQMLAKKSLSDRAKVISALIGVLRDPRARRAESVAAWSASAGLLGDLRAAEAIPILVQNLDFSEGTVGLSLGHAPAVLALIKIGKPAIPSLIQALSAERPSVRRDAARALGEIGNRKAIEPLKRALKWESDKEARFYIERALSKLNPG